MSRENKKCSGYLLTELIVALTILGMLFIVLASSLYGFAKFNRYQLVRQRCISAAQAQLDSIAVTGKPIPDQDFKRLWPRLTVSVHQSPGTGQWEGMKLVSVTARGGSFNKEVEVQLHRYILAKPVSRRIAKWQPQTEVRQ